MNQSQGSSVVDVPFSKQQFVKSLSSNENALANA